MRVPVLLTALAACRPAPEPTTAPSDTAPPVEQPRLPDTSTPTREAPPDPRIEAPPVAFVGEARIEWEAFEGIYDLKVKKYRDRGREIPDSADRRYRKSIAERLVYHEQIRQEVEALGVTHDAAALARRKRQHKLGITDWESHLQRRGETDASLDAMFIAELREAAILEHTGALDVKDDEVREDYEKIKDNWRSDKPRVRASHIFVPDEPGAKAKAKQLHKLATAPGADFAAVAREHSVGPSAFKGGDIGIFTHDRMAVEFADAAFKLKPGKISKPVKTKFGWHVIKVTGKWPPGLLPLDALRDQIANRLRQRKLHQGRRDLKDRLQQARPATWFIVLDPTRAHRPSHGIGRPTIEDGSEIDRDGPLD